MKVKRIVANIETQDIVAAKSFYQDVLGLDLLMEKLNTDTPERVHASPSGSLLGRGIAASSTPPSRAKPCWPRRMDGSRLPGWWRGSCTWSWATWALGTEATAKHP